MDKNILNDLLKQNIPINFIDGKDIRVIIQDDDIRNEGWKSDVKAIKLLIHIYKHSHTSYNSNKTSITSF